MKKRIFKIWVLMCFTLSILGNGIGLAATAVKSTTTTKTKTTTTTTTPAVTTPATTPAPAAPVVAPVTTSEPVVVQPVESTPALDTASASTSRKSRRKAKEEKPKLSKEEQAKAKADKEAAKAQAKADKEAAKAQAKALKEQQTQEKKAKKEAEKLAKQQAKAGQPVTTDTTAMTSMTPTAAGMNAAPTTTVEPAPLNSEAAMISTPGDTKVRRVKKVVTSKKEKTVKVKGFKKVNIYTDSGDETNNFTPTGWMGDYGDMKLSTKCFITPKKGSTCIKIFYSAKKSQGAGWAGIYWQEPANNWGDVDKGLNLTGAKKLTFYARGDRGGEIIEVFKVGGIKGIYPDTTDVSFGPIMLTKKWKKFTIKLKNKDLTRISGGFGWVTSAETNPDGMVFYLDEIQYQ
jgi:hypothetical protein